MKIIFASQNPNKLNEIQSQLANYTVVGLDPLLFPEELQETGTTLYATSAIAIILVEASERYLL